MNWPGARRDKRLSENQTELQFHLEAEIEDNIARGMSPEKAASAARRKLGNMTRIREDVFSMGKFSFLETSWRDVQYATRAMRKSVGFTLTAVLTLAIGIGGNTAVFTVIRAVLLKPLAYPDSQQLVRISVDGNGEEAGSGSVLPLRFKELKSSAQSFEAISAYLKVPESMSLSGSGAPEGISGARVAANFFQTLKITPIAGRSFLPEEDAPGGPNVMIISSALWSRRFGRDPQIVGKPTTLNGLAYTIVGVLPSDFAFPFTGIDVWVTRPTEWSVLPRRFWDITPLYVFGRVKPTATIKQTRAELRILDRQYVRAHPGNMDARSGLKLNVTPLQSQLVSGVGPTLWLLLGAIAFVLLIVCANIAGLLLARATARSREFALRAALGASRGRIVRQLLIESLVLATAGGLAGICLAIWLLRWARHVSALNVPGLALIRLDSSVLAFTGAICIISGILFGLVPALRISRRDLVSELRQSGAGAVWAVHQSRWVALSTRGMLAAAQISLSVVLLIGAALLMKSFIHLRSVDPGFESSRLLTAKIALPMAGYDSPEKRDAFFRELVRRVKDLPGVVDATVAMSIPTSSGWIGTNVLVQGQPVVDGSQQPTARLQSVTAGYFRTMRIPLRRGRYFTEEDSTSVTRAAVIVNESFVHRFWPTYPLGINPIGQHLREGVDHTGDMEIVGIVGDVHEEGLASTSGPEFFVPLVVHPPQIAYLAVRTARDPLSYAPAIRKAVLTIDRNEPVSDINTMDEILNATLGQRRVTLMLFSAFSAMALLLSIVGIYGIVAYSVEQRTQEVGIRTALGAQKGDILRLIVVQGLILAVIGIAIGSVGAFLLTRVMVHLLFNVSATDTVIFLLTPAVFVFVSVLASYVPARRAANIDPMIALRVA